MTVKQYIEEKNAIVFKHTGIKLVPDSQIIDMPGYAEPLFLHTDDDTCPYCHYYYDNKFESCIGCPMHEANNDCNCSNSSYQRIIKHLNNYAIVRHQPIREELSFLITKFNSEL